MELNRFARIGKGVLTKAIGLQSNHVEYDRGPDVLNETASGCLNCPIHKAKEDLRLYGLEIDADHIHCMCKDCDSSVWSPSYTRKVYVNEKNKFGYQPTLKTNSIKLLILYHFLQPDAHGFVLNIKISELAETLGCSQTTIRACNSILEEYGYCQTTAGWDNGTISVFLPEYKNYHKTAAEGGRGYITMSADMLDKLLGIPALNALRLNLKGILLVDNASVQEAKKSPLQPVSSTYTNLRCFLPRYCKRNVIKKSLAQDDSIFLLDFHDKSVVFNIREEFAQRHMRDAMVDDATEQLKDYVDSINEVIEQASDESRDGNKETDMERIRQSLSEYHISPAEKYPVFCISLSDYRDLASLAVQYNMHFVKVALGQIYSRFICKNHAVESIGALARTMIRKLAVFQEAA